MFYIKDTNTNRYVTPLIYLKCLCRAWLSSERAEALWFESEEQAGDRISLFEKDFESNEINVVLVVVHPPK